MGDVVVSVNAGNKDEAISTLECILSIIKNTNYEDRRVIEQMSLSHE